MTRPRVGRRDPSTITAALLWGYADKWARDSERLDRGTAAYPTVVQAAKRFKVSQARIRELVEEGIDGDRYLGLIVSIGVPGLGTAELINSRHQVEAY